MYHDTFIAKRIICFLCVRMKCPPMLVIEILFYFEPLFWLFLGVKVAKVSYEK